ncbi:MAG: hypothetical protein J6B77_09170 [Clostridia bacterium]|nr:hypothetical protein [Clostridia bacterium]
MAGFFKQNQAQQVLTPRGIMERQYASSRANLLLAVIFTLINLVMLVLGTGTYFLFSIFIPYYLANTGWYLCGKCPADWYEDAEPFEFFDTSFLVVMLVIAFVMLAFYGLAWGLSKKRVGWLIAALVFFIIDTVLMLVIYLDAGLDFSVIIDILFHAWVLYYLIQGIRAHIKLKDLPPDEEPIEEFGAPEGEGTDENASFDASDSVSEESEEKDASDENVTSDQNSDTPPET